MSEDFSTLSHVAPSLTDERLTEALTKWYGDNVKFTHWEYVSDTGKGDSYMSDVMRIRIHGKNQEDVSKHVQVILKIIPRSISRRLTFRSDQFFKNEIVFYEIVLPSLLKFQSSKNLKEPFNNCARLFSSYCDGVDDFICLEDASLENFGSIAVRQEGIDYTHCKVTLHALAKFHAISFAMKDQEPEEFDRIKKVVFETFYDDSIWGEYERFWKRLCNVAIDAVEKEYPDSIYLEKIKEFAVPERYLKVAEALKSTYDTTGVLSHGDCWTNNFLYKYEGQVPIDALMIDFQLTRCASPVFDLSFVIYACTTQELRLKHYDEFLKYYYDVLTTQIDGMGSDAKRIYPWSLYMEEMKKFSFYGLAFSFESTPFIVLPPEEALDMDMKGDQKMNIDDAWSAIGPFRTKEGRLREANNVVHCVDNGFI